MNYIFLFCMAILELFSQNNVYLDEQTTVPEEDLDMNELGVYA